MGLKRQIQLQEVIKKDKKKKKKKKMNNCRNDWSQSTVQIKQDESADFAYASKTYIALKRLYTSCIDQCYPIIHSENKGVQEYF